jgi:hypothetical protein
MTYVDTPFGACLLSFVVSGGQVSSPVRFRSDHSVVRSPLWARIDLSVPPAEAG